MSNAEKLKGLIAKELTHFCLLDNTPPRYICVSVVYEQCMARLEIPTDKIAAIFKEDAIC